MNSELAFSLAGWTTDRVDPHNVDPEFAMGAGGNVRLAMCRVGEITVGDQSAQGVEIAYEVSQRHGADHALD